MKNKRNYSTKYLLYLEAPLILLLFCCASAIVTQELPGWIIEPTSKYHEALYLSAVGSGSSREEAKREAMSSLSNIFRVEVYSDRRIIKVYTEKSKGDKIDVDHSINLLTKSALKSENELINVREGETFFDDKRGTFYVLLFINRAQTEPLYLEEIEKNDRVLEEYYRSSREADTKFDKFIYLKKAIQVASINKELRQTHRLISHMEDSLEPPISLQKLNLELYDLGRKIITNIEIIGEFPEEIAGFLREVIQETGFAIGSENVDLTIKAHLKIEPLSLPREGKFVRWRFLVDVNNAMTGNTMETFTKEGREGHSTLEAAKSRALREVGKIIKDEFYLEFNNFLNRSLIE
jgi:hypothetical protein